MFACWPFKKKNHGKKASRKARPAPRASLEMEALEDRNLMSWSTVPLAISPPLSSVQIDLNPGIARGSAAIVSNEIDYYSFVAPKAGSYRFAAQTPSSDLNTILGVFDATGAQVGQNNDVATGNTDSQTFASLVAGERYFLGITNVRFTPNGSYNWNVIGPDDIYEQNDTFATARNLGTLTTVRTFTNLVSADQDWYKFTLTNPPKSGSFAEISFNNAQGNLDLRLYNALGTELAVSEGTANTERVSLGGLPAGTFYLQVAGFQGDINPKYSLKINPDDGFEENDTPAAASDLGTLVGPRTITSLALTDTADWYKFKMDYTGTYDNSVEIRFKNIQGNLQLGLYNATGTTLLRSSQSTGDFEQISLNGMAAGTYLVKVFGNFGAKNPDYSLSFTGNYFPDDGYENNDTFASRSYLGYVLAPTTISGLAFGDNADYFGFYNEYLAESSDFVSIQFDPARGNLDLRLLDNTGQEIASSLSTTDGIERISLAGLGRGEYVVHVSSPDGSLVPSYSLTIDPGEDDRFEDNDIDSVSSNLVY